jgi:tetratricopeptide (TPR) repeat protein
MRAAAIALCAMGLAGCLGPVTAQSAETAWRQCQGQGAPEFRVNQCSIVIDYAETAPERRAEALVTRGRIRVDQAQFGRAMTDFGRALRINSRNAQAYAARGILHQVRGAYDVAMRDFELALSIEPTLETALTGREDALANRVVQFREQLQALTERLQDAPSDANLLNNRCWLRVINDDDLDAALTDCNAALQASPGNSAALDSRGLVHLKRGDFAAAIADYDAALAIDGGRGHYLYGRGIARIRMGLTAEGQADLVEAERLEPGIAAQYRTYHVAL